MIEPRYFGVNRMNKDEFTEYLRKLQSAYIILHEKMNLDPLDPRYSELQEQLNAIEREIADVIKKLT
jgi:hypothetical protein